jgi:hypothetical protein
MGRVTEKQLKAVVQRLNKVTGNPTTSYTQTATEVIANVGNYHLDFAYGCVGLVQMSNKGGGVNVIIPGCTKVELYYRLQAMIEGIQAQKEQQKATQCHVDTAPMLLKALKDILVWDDGNLPGDLLDEAQQAIDKAEGKESQS